LRAPQEPQAGSASTISRTTLPPRQHIRCYECQYEFNLTGRMTSTHCPKCRASLDLAGYTIDAECREILKTLGAIKITPRGIVSSSALVATDLDLAGKVSESTVEVFSLLTIQPGADFIRGNIRTPDVKLQPNAEMSLKNLAVFRNVEIYGTLRTHLYSTGTVTLRAGGALFGGVYGGHLVVEDGATLIGEVVIGPEGLARVEKAQTQAAMYQRDENSERVMVLSTAPAPATAAT
jgi:cytoskeletal protein CcmA (bactofilin family)